MNDEAALMLINRFGWLTAFQIGSALFPDSSTASKGVAGNRLMVDLTERNLTLLRIVRGPTGRYLRVYVLASKGAQLLNMKMGEGTESGESLGKYMNSSQQIRVNSKKYALWSPPDESTEHALLTNGYLTLLIGMGHQVMTSRELRKIKGLKKIPDGLALFGAVWSAIEVERGEKLGNRLNQLVGSIINYQTESCVINNLQVKDIVIAFDHAQVADGRQVNHQVNITRALKSHLKNRHEVHIGWAELEVDAGKVIGVTHKHELISSSKSDETSLNNKCASREETSKLDDLPENSSRFDYITDLQQDLRQNWTQEFSRLTLNILNGIVRIGIIKDFITIKGRRSNIKYWVSVKFWFYFGLTEDLPHGFRKRYENHLAQTYQFDIQFDLDDAAGAKEAAIEEVLTCIPILEYAYYRQTGFLLAHDGGNSRCIFLGQKLQCRRRGLGDDCYCFDGENGRARSCFEP